MLVNRSKEEIVHVEDEMKRFHCGLKNAEKKLEEPKTKKRKDSSLEDK